MWPGWCWIQPDLLRDLLSMAVTRLFLLCESMSMDITHYVKHCTLVYTCPSLPCVGRLSTISASSKNRPVVGPQLVASPLGTLCRSMFGLSGPSNVGWWPAIVLISLELDSAWNWSFFGANLLEMPVHPHPCLAPWALYIWAWQVALAPKEEKFKSLVSLVSPTEATLSCSYALSLSCFGWWFINQNILPRTSL